jgi:hypothetical protein
MMIWLLRPENDRWLGFISVSNIRGSITFEEFGGIQLPIPTVFVFAIDGIKYFSILSPQTLVTANSLFRLSTNCM